MYLGEVSAFEVVGNDTNLILKIDLLSNKN